MCHANSVWRGVAKFIGGGLFGACVMGIGAIFAAGTLATAVPSLAGGLIVGGFTALTGEDVVRGLPFIGRRRQATDADESNEPAMATGFRTTRAMALCGAPFIVVVSSLVSALFGVLNVLSHGEPVGLKGFTEAFHGAFWFSGLYAHAVVSAIIVISLIGAASWCCAFGIKRAVKFVSRAGGAS